VDLLIDAGFTAQIRERALHALECRSRLTRDLRKTLTEDQNRNHEDHDQLGKGQPEELHDEVSVTKDRDERGVTSVVPLASGPTVQRSHAATRSSA
jgi:hypothetical protein